MVILTVVAMIGFATKSVVGSVASGLIILVGCIVVAIFWSVGAEIDDY